MLNDVTVLEIGDRLSTGYAGKMLRDAGATVVRIEIAAGSTPESSNRDFMTFLHGGKHSVSPTSFRQLATEFPELSRRADAIICDDDDPDVLTLGRALRAQQPDLVVVSISDYGLNGAEPSTPATEFTLQAESGLTAVHPTGGRPPVYTGVDLGEFAAGLNAAIGVVVGLLSTDAGAGPVDADISRYESLVSILQSPWMFSQHADHAPYAIPQAAVPGLEKAKDGWACVVSVTPQQWTDFKAMAGIPELDDPRFEHLADRLHLTAEITPYVRQFTQQYTVAELVEMGARCRVPIVPVSTSATVADLPPYTTRGTFVAHPDGFTQPRPAFRIDDETWTPGALAEPGRDNDATWGERPVRPTPQGADPRRPLAGIRVVELGSFQAGPLATRALAYYGADVVKVESVTRPDLFRFGGPLGSAADAWERGASFTSTNWGKRSVTADLKDPQGHEIVERLIAASDLVLENFSPRVLEQVGFDAAGIQRLRPDAVVMRLPAWGLTSPWKDLPGFTYSADATSGLSDLTGYPDGDPLLTGTTIDPIAADTSTFIALAALRQRIRTGRGTVVEVSLCDVAPQVTAGATIESSRTGARVERRGNDAPGMSPQGMYQGADGTWAAISIASDDQWRALGTVTGGADWARNPNHADLAGRQADRDAIDVALRGFVGAQDSSDLVARLHAAGIPAAVMLSGEQAHRHPAVLARARNVELFHVVNGTKQHLAPPVRLSSNPAGSIPRPSPLFGEHNDEVLTELGYEKDEIQRLRDAGKIGDSPFGLPIGDRHPPRD